MFVQLSADSLWNAKISDTAVVGPYSIVGKRPTVPVGLLRREPEQTGKATKIGDGTVIGCHVVIYENVEIGENCLIGDGCIIREGTRIGNNTLIGNRCVVCYDVNVGDNVRIMDGSVIAGLTVVEDSVFIGPGVITTNDRNQKEGATSEVLEILTFRRGCKIGGSASFLAGVTVGENSHVGLGSVVTKDVAANTLVMGCPARFVRLVNDESAAKKEFIAADGRDPDNGP